MPLSQNSLFVEAFITIGNGDHVSFLVSLNSLISLFFLATTLSHPLHMLAMVIDASSLNSFFSLYLLSFLFFAFISNGDQH